MGVLKLIAGALPAALPEKSKFYDFDEMVVEGNGVAYTHIVLNVPESMSSENLPSLILFLTQLVEAGEKEQRKALLTLRFLSGEGRTPIVMLPLTKDVLINSVAEIVNGHLKDKKKDLLKRSSDVLVEEASSFSWKPLQELFYKESESYYVNNRIVFLFQPEGLQVPAPSEEADLIVAASPKDKAIYPFNLTFVKSSGQTDKLTQHFSVLSSCEMHRRFVEIFGEYAKSAGQAPLNLLFEESPEIARSFILKNALRSLAEKSEDASACDGTFAFETAEQYYFNFEKTDDGIGDDDALEQINDVVTGWCQSSRARVEKNDPTSDGWAFYYEKVQYKCHIPEGLSLLIDGVNRLPKPEEIVGSSAGYYELLKETGGNKDVPSYFIYSILKILLLTPNERILRRIIDMGSPYKGPRFEETMSQYLRTMGATPINLWEAFYKFGLIEKANLEKYGKFLNFVREDGAFYLESFLYEQYILGQFAPLKENFQKLPPDEQEREVEKLIDYVHANIKDIIGRNDYSNVVETLDVLAIDIVYSAIEGNAALKEKFTKGIFAALTNLGDADIAGYKSSWHLIYYLHRRKLLSSKDSEDIVRWTLRRGNLHESFTASAYHIWHLLWPLMNDEAKLELSPKLMEKALEIYVGAAKRKAGYLSSIFGHHSNDKLTLSRTVSEIFSADQLAKMAVELINRYPPILADVEKYIFPMLVTIQDTKPDKWKQIVEYITANSDEGWMLAPYMLDITTLYGSTEEEGKVLAAIHAGLQKVEEDEKPFRRKLFNDDRYYIVSTIKALYENDIKGLIGLHNSYNNAKSASTSPERKKMNDHLIGRLMTRQMHSNLLTYFLSNVVSIIGTLDEKQFDSFFNSFEQDGYLRIHGYDDNIHGELVEKLLDNYAVILRSRKRKEQIDKLLEKAFDNAPFRRKLKILSAFIRLMPTFHGKDLEAFLNSFAIVLSDLEISYGVGEGSTRELLLATKPVFPLLVAALKSGEVDPGHPFIMRFLGEWKDKISIMPFDVQCEVFIYLTGPLAVSSLAYSNSFFNEMITAIVGYSYEGELNKKGKAAALGRYIALSTYAVQIAQTLAYKDSFLDPIVYEGLLEGFIEEAYSKRALEKYSIELVAEILLFRYWLIQYTGFESKSDITPHYYNYLPKLLQLNPPPEIVRLSMQPLRNHFYSMLSSKKMEYGNMQEADAFREILTNEKISSSTRAYIRDCLKQIVDDLSTLPNASVPYLDRFKGVVKNALFVIPAKAGIQ
jgi:hypothetical protein